MKISQELLNTKTPTWAQEAPSPQKVGEHLGAVSQASPVFPSVTGLAVQYFNWEFCKRKFRAGLFCLPLPHQNQAARLS